MKRKVGALLLGSIMTINLVSAMPVAATTAPYPTDIDAEIFYGYQNAYDFDQTGTVDQLDILKLQDLVIAPDSPYGVLDLVIAYQIFCDTWVVNVPVTRLIYAPILEPGAETENLLRNYFASDYPCTVWIYSDRISFQFLQYEGKTALIFDRVDASSEIAVDELAAYNLSDGTKITFYEDYTAAYS